MGESPLNRKGRTIYETKKIKEECHIFDEDQLVKTTWNNFTKKYYTGLGYKFTKIGDEFFLKAKDLKRNAVVYITGICDYCGREKQILMRDYTKSTKNQTVPFTCGNNLCTQKKLNDMYGKERKQKQIQYYYDFCNKYNYTPLSNVDDYINARTKLKYVCPIHGEQQICVNDIKVGHACQQCGYIKSKTKNTLPIEKVIKIIEDKNNTLINPQDYQNAASKNLLIKCGECGKIRKTSLSSIMNSKGHCPECGAKYLGRQITLSSAEVEKRINSVNGNTLLNPEDYIGIGVKNLKVRCSCGNIFKVSLGNYMWGTPNRCRFCSQKTSKGELKILTKLEDMGIKYEQEKCFADCKDKRCLPFDFYLPDHNTIIEFDGQHHYFPTHSMCTCTGVMTSLSFDNVIAQWDAEHTEWMADQKSEQEEYISNRDSEFTSWFNGVKDTLSTDAAGKLNTRIDGLATISMNLKSTSWTGSGPYRQRVSISGMTSSRNFGPMFVVPTGNQETDAANAEALGCLSYGVTGSGYVDIYCYDQKPDITFTVYASGRI